MVMENPATIDAIAARSVNFGQNSERIIIGQKVAAIPDQPKITNQKIVRSGDSTETVTASPSASAAIARVTIRHSLAASASPSPGLITRAYRSWVSEPAAMTSSEDTVDMIAASTAAT